MNLALLTPEFGVLGLALVVFLAEMLGGEGAKRRWLGWLCALGFAAVLAWLLAQPLPPASAAPPTAFGGLYVSDGLARVFKIILLAAAALTALASVDALEARGLRWQGDYYLLLTLVTAAMLFVVSAGDLLTLYVALELNSLGFYALVSILKGRSLVSAEAGIKYLVLGALASAFLLYGFSILYGLSGTLSLQGLAAWAKGAQAGPALGLAVALVASALAFKLGLVPFHMVLPDVYQAAPAPIAGYLSVGSKAAALAVTVRLLEACLVDLSGTWAKLFMLLMGLTFLWANAVALKQKDLKRLLAYSSVAQAGYLLLGVVAGSPLGLQALLFYSLVYVFTNLAAFQVLELLAAQGGGELEDLSGLSQRSPGLALALLASMLSLAGVPPFGGFFGKYLLFAAGMEQGLQGRPWLLALVALAVAMSIVSLFYYLVVVKKMYIAEGGGRPPLKSTPAARLGLGICAAMLLWTGVYPTPILDWLKQVLP